MAPKKNKSRVMNDNWENLDVIATNTNILNPAQYSKVINDVVSEVTGTEISKQTREKHSFYRKLSNLTAGTKHQSPTQITNNSSGGYQFDKNIPNWDDVTITKVLQHTWDQIIGQWMSRTIYGKIAPLPFGRGSLRLSYYCLNLGDDIAAIKHHVSSSEDVNIQLASGCTISQSERMSHNEILFNRLIGNKNVFGGKLCVAKKNFGLCDSTEAYFYDVRTQCESQKFAAQYNRHHPPKKVAFLQASVIEPMENEEETEEIEFYCLESFLHGSYIKHIDNHGGDDKTRNTPSAFAHFTYEASNKRLLVCDIQGVGDLYTDPQIHTYHGKGFGMGNLGNDGIIKFFKTHECNAICKHFKFSSTQNMGINEDLIYGTRPEKQYMKKKRIDVVDTMYIDNKKYLLQLPQLYHKNIRLSFCGEPTFSYSSQTNINININNNNNKREEKQRLLGDVNDCREPYQSTVSDSEACCCKCNIL
eukprot:224480_1